MSYARKNFDNSPPRAIDQLLMHIKTHGASSTSALAQVLGVSSEAVRQHLTRLVEQGIVEGERSSTGVGRPKQLWRLTQAGHARFPDTHAQLTVQLIQMITQVFGEAGVQRIVESRSAKQLDEYRAQLSSCTKLIDRVTRLADLRTEEGYMARVEHDGDDLLLIEDHCPICAAASTCQGFCASELAQFQTLMRGWAEVSREEYLQHGANRCVYRLRRDESSKSLCEPAEGKITSS
ncbi:helix-turn-helix transcriptional regulator [Chromobacterium sp. CV08]|uniref:helix-turn-helix transcriptional regulator n=1 Tax=Chromobacterium sp. CV08 TaxID=3133274 RepID=UPI003DA9E94B